MINRVILVGRLTRDPELRKTQNGTSVVSFSLAVNRRVQTPGQPDADFINCVAWNRLADLMCQYLHRGSLIGVEGRIQTRNYDNNQGQRVYVTEVVADNVQFLEPKNATHPAQSSNPYPQTPADPYGQPAGMQSAQDPFGTDFDTSDTLDIASDDLPF
ncbi:single-stranded DNA-binding protein [uncultured Faecalicoccus sp.]|uniref:single-stranded DNA-binding protein n=1 Tax=uncultured Faecalicoccus sp. TaxID=1971760 RepID=UPI0025E084C0|nr:single-stranded DNA-binding protein [uncultured Faecalicoccus sp.]